MGSQDVEIKCGNQRCSAMNRLILLEHFSGPIASDRKINRTCVFRRMRAFWPNHHIFSAIGLLIWKRWKRKSQGLVESFCSSLWWYTLTGRLRINVEVFSCFLLASLAAIQVSDSLALLWGTLRMQRKKRWMAVVNPGVDGSTGWSSSMARSAEWRQRTWLYRCWLVLSIIFVLSAPKIGWLMMKNDD